MLQLHYANNYHSICHRIPKIPAGNMADSEGFLFETEQQRVASYLVTIDTLGLISEHGCSLPFDRWLDTSFLLPFKLSHELNSYPNAISERVLQSPTVKNGRTRLFLEFASATQSVLRRVK